METIFKRPNLPINKTNCTALDQTLAGPMFVVSLLFLLGTGALLHLTEGDFSSPLGLKIIAALALLYLAIMAETAIHWHSGANNMRQHWRYLLLPVMRICPQDHGDGSSTWIPALGWCETSDILEDFLSRTFSLPMIIIALLVLPVVGVEFFYADMISQNELGRFAINTCSGFIWMAFVFEFVIMFSVVNKRFVYCKKNWIDLAVILLPLVSFMGAARLGRLMKLNQLSRTAKIYRMRGLAIRAWRAVVALDVIDSLLRLDPDQRIEKLREKIQEREFEIGQLRMQLDKIEAKQLRHAADVSLPLLSELAQADELHQPTTTNETNKKVESYLDIFKSPRWIRQAHQI